MKYKVGDYVRIIDFVEVYEDDSENKMEYINYIGKIGRIIYIHIIQDANQDNLTPFMVKFDDNKTADFSEKEIRLATEKELVENEI